jgi:NAD(P)H dehydrogenase (quinone)
MTAPRADGPVAVVGSAGQTGLAAIRALTSRGTRTRALVHRQEQEATVRSAGATEVVVIDLDEPSTLHDGYAGAWAVLHIPPLFDQCEQQRSQHSMAAAASSGVERFVLHSVLHPFTPGLRHHARKAGVEADLRRSGLRWTILQPGMYMSTLTGYWDRSPAGTATLPFSLDAPFTPVALADVAAATTRVLTEDAHEFATYELAGPQVLTGREMLAILCQASGENRRIRRGDLSDLVLPAEWGEGARDDMRAMCAHYDEHGLVGNRNVLAWLLGRQPVDFAAAASG